MKLKDILIWLGIFIVGSLIVSSFLNPNSISYLKDNLQSSLNKNIQVKNYTEFHYNGDRCSVLELYSKYGNSNANSFKKDICIILCSGNEMDYEYWDCKKDKLYCYCEDW